MAKLGRIAGNAGGPAVQFDQAQDRYVWDAVADMMVAEPKTQHQTPPNAPATPNPRA